MSAFVVGGDSDVNKFSGRVRIAECNDRNVDVAGFFDRLRVRARIGYDDETWFLERASDVVGEISRCEASRDGYRAGVGGEFEYRALAIGSCGYNTDIGRIVNSDNDSSSENDLLPSRC